MRIFSSVISLILCWKKPASGPHFKSEFLLRKIAENHYQGGCAYLAHGRVEVEVVHKYLHQHIIQYYTNGDQHKIAEQLNASPQVGFRKYHVLTEEETGWKSNGHRHEEGGNMCAHVEKYQVHHLLVQHKVITHKIQQDIQHCIAAATGKITECLQRHHLCKRRIKEAEYL